MAAAAPEAGWKCGFCACDNPELFLQCKLCGSDKPAGAAVSSGPPAASPNQMAVAAAEARSASSSPASVMFVPGGNAAADAASDGPGAAEFSGKSRKQLIDEILSLRATLAALQGDMLRTDESAAASREADQARAAAASQRLIIEDLKAQVASGAKLPRQSRNFLILHDLGKTAADIESEDCPVCYGERALANSVVLPGCGHSFCVDCALDVVTTNVQSANIAGLVCPEDGCDTRLPYAEVMDLLSGPDHAADREKFDRFSVTAFLQDVGNAMTCPFRECQASFIVEHGSPRVDCPHCKKAFCAHCPGKPEYHTDSTCAKYQEWLVANGKGDDEFKKLFSSKQSRIKACPKCKTPVWKPPRTNGGACNWLRCRCRHTFCFLCLKGPLGDDHYAHFKEPGPCKGKLFYDAPDTLE